MSQKLILLVRCPKCNYKQQTESLKIVRCHNCMSSYEVYTDKETRIVRIVQGSQKELLRLRQKTLKLPRIGEI